MARVTLSERVHADFDCILDHLFEFAPEMATARIASIVEALDILQHSPLIGRPVESGLRELVIASGRSGYLALYRYLSELDAVFVLAVRSQREAGYRDL
jgi:plasmid stabilization system protein ParE